ncbi:hypothetical protein DNTS_027449 [Danionella cerebrum]|uniref:Uncharacterized protein n=1 Tax=Danionella cerebrum TaxID=2873325 RepID=A0A553Q4C2_9TELE|nr:hypothetical protein DNTS_027449 [Danionella translucida]
MLTPFFQTPPNATFTTNMALWGSMWQSSLEKRTSTHTLFYPAGGLRLCSSSVAWPRVVTSAAVCAAAVTAAVGSVNLILLTQMNPSSMCLQKIWKLRCNPMRED